MSANTKFLKVADRSYKEVRRTIVRNQQKKKNNTDVGVVEEGYVDSYRSVAVHFGTTDLKNQMAKTGMKVNIAPTAGPGEPNDEMFLKQAEHLMKRSIFGPAELYLDQALSMNPNSKNVIATKAKCYLMMGRWEEASEAADLVLDKDKTFVKALLVKAEALYNTCLFEKALVLFHRGQVLAPDMEDFRLGIQKCRKTIQCTVRKEFSFDEAEPLFREMRDQCEALSATLNVQSEMKLREARKQKERRAKSLQERAESSSDLSKTSKGVIVADIMMKLEKEGSTDHPSLSAKHGRKSYQSLNRQKSSKISSTDRLGEDKEYLNRLASGIGNSNSIQGVSMESQVSTKANEALEFLKARDEFWKQVELGNKQVFVPTPRLDFDSMPRSS